MCRTDLSPAGEGRAEEGEGSTFWAPQSREPGHKLRIPLDPEVRLLKDGGLLGGPPLQDPGEPPRCTRPIFPLTKSQWFGVWEALLFSAAAYPHMYSIFIVLQG